MSGKYVKIVYTTSDVRDLVPLTLKSLKSLSKFTDKKNIIVFYTPPRSNRNLVKLQQLAVVKQASNIIKPFRVHQHQIGRYGEKIHICDVDCLNVIFLDCDTVIKKDLTPLLDGEFDFAARSEIFDFATRSKLQEYQSSWETMFKQFNKKPIPMPNSGFMIFKNYCHKKIGEEWRKLMESDSTFGDRYIAREQCTLALCISEKRIRWLTAHQHAFRWRGETKVDTYVLHGRGIRIEKIPKQLFNRLNSVIYRPQKFSMVSQFSC